MLKSTYMYFAQNYAGIIHQSPTESRVVGLQNDVQEYTADLSNWKKHGTKPQVVVNNNIPLASSLRRSILVVLGYANS